MRIVISLFCLLLFISCSDDTIDMMEEETDEEIILLLKEIYRNGELISTYQFNNDSTIQTVLLRNAGQPTTRITYDYAIDEIMRTSIDVDSEEVLSSVRYSRISDTQGKREQFNSEGDLVTTTIYNFDNDPCGFISTQRIDALNNPIYETRIEYNDENCSSTVYKNFDGVDEYVEWEYTRIDKFSANNSTTVPFFQVDKMFAITNQVRKSSQGTVSTNLSYNAVFEFNSEDHPVEEVRTYLDGDVEEYVYTYY